MNVPHCPTKSELKEELNGLTHHVGFSMEPTEAWLKFALPKIIGKVFLKVFFLINGKLIQTRLNIKCKRY